MCAACGSRSFAALQAIPSLTSTAARAQSSLPGQSTHSVECASERWQCPSTILQQCCTQASCTPGAPTETAAWATQLSTRSPPLAGKLSGELTGMTRSNAALSVYSCKACKCSGKTVDHAYKTGIKRMSTSMLQQTVGQQLTAWSVARCGSPALPYNTAGAGWAA